MTKILIESNPYEKKIKYSRYDENNDDYIPVEDDSTSSLLLSDAYVNCYFLSNAQDIVNQIIDEYGDDLEIVFEGVTEEFEGLQELIKTDKVYETIKITKGAESLEDPQNVIKQFQDISKVIDDIADNCDVVDNDKLSSLFNNTLNAKTSIDFTIQNKIKQLCSLLEKQALSTKKTILEEIEVLDDKIGDEDDVFLNYMYDITKHRLISNMETIITEKVSEYLKYALDENDSVFRDYLISLIPLVGLGYGITKIVSCFNGTLQNKINKESKLYWQLKSDELNILIGSVAYSYYSEYDDDDYDFQNMIAISNAEYNTIDVDTSINAIDLLGVLTPYVLHTKAMEMYKQIYEGHSKIFEKWAKNDLLNAVKSKIDTLNPQLKRIKQKKDEIDNLIERKKQLEQYCCILDEQIQRIANTFSLKK